MPFPSKLFLFGAKTQQLGLFLDYIVERPYLQDTRTFSEFMDTEMCRNLTPLSDMSFTPSTSPDTTVQWSAESQSTLSASPDSKQSWKKTTIEDFFLLKIIGKGSFGVVLLSKHKATSKLYDPCLDFN